MANDYTLTIDVGAGQVSTTYSNWSGVTGAINANKANLIYAKITQNGSPTLPTNFGSIFRDCPKLETVEYENLDVSKVTAMNLMYRDSPKLVSITGTADWVTSSLVNVGSMYQGCTALTTVEMANWDMSKVTTIAYLLINCPSIVIFDMSGWVTPLLANTSFMFYTCPNLVTIYAGDGWDMSAVTSGDMMFLNCTKLVGAVAYNPSQTSVAMANWTTGYLTYKAPPAPQTNIPVFMAHYARLRNA